MEGKKSILDYMAQVLIIFGFAMICMLCFVLVFGESAKEYSPLFELEKRGITITVMAQFLLLSILVVFWQFLFNIDKIVNRLSDIVRSVAMVLSVFFTTMFFIVLFDWFPLHMWEPWVMFLLCFLISGAGSAFLSIMKNKLENKKLEEGLNRLKDEWRKEEEDEQNKSA